MRKPKEPYDYENRSELIKKVEQVMATSLFGLHHLIKKIQDCDHYALVMVNNDLATFDYATLTRLVILAHDKCLRMSITQAGPRRFKLMFHDRQREGSKAQRHPTIEQAIEEVRSGDWKPEKGYVEKGAL
jgi:hypothetical protein